MRENVNVDQVLDEVIAEMKRGAGPWKIEKTEADEVRRRYRLGFEQTLGNDRGAQWWAAFSGKVLRMSKCVGTFAAFFAERKGHDLKKDPVRLEHLLMALGIVKLWCTAGVHTEAFGPPCEHASVSEGVPYLKEFLKETLDGLDKL